MMDQLPLLGPQADTVEFCAGQAEAIRVLVRRTAADILDVGRRLIAVKEKLAHGEWLPWLDREFGWTEETARKFMRVADMIGKSQLDWNLAGLSIDAGALYMIAAPNASAALRQEVIEQAKDGKHITVEEAEIIAARQVADAIKMARQERDEAVQAAVKRAAEQIKDLHDELAERDEAAVSPSLDDAIDLLCKTTGKKKPSGRLIQALARELGEPISYGGKTYPPVDDQASAKATADLQKAAEFGRTLSYFAGELPPPAEMLHILPAYMRDSAMRNAPLALQWLHAFTELMGE